MQKRNILNSPRLSELKNKRRKIFKRNIIIFSVLFLILVGGLSYISRIGRFNISTVEVQGNKIIDKEAVIEIVNHETAGKYFWLFPKTNILLYPKSRLTNKIANKFKRFKDISLSVGTGKNLVVSVSERSPEYTWCGDVPPQADAKETCYFLDKEGYIFDEAPYFSGEVYFKFYGRTGKEGNPSGAYLAKGYFDKLIVFKNDLVNMKLKPVVLYIEEGENIKILLSKPRASSPHPEIIFKKDSDFGKIATNFKAALETEPLLSKFKNEYSNLEYVDLRFGNKVYYRFK